MSRQDNQAQSNPGQRKKPDRLKTAAKALREIALREHVPVEVIREQIQGIILEWMESTDPQAQEHREKIPRAGEIPTPEEFVAYCAELVRE